MKTIAPALSSSAQLHILDLYFAYNAAHWDETLPDADVLVVMFPDDENREYYLNEWLQQFPCIVYMTAEGCIDVVTHEQAQSTALQA